MNRIWWWLLGAVAAVLIVAMAALPGAEEPGNQEGPGLVQLRRDPTLDERDSLGQARQAERVVEQINGVDRAWVAVVDRTAYIGIELGPGVDEERAQRIERTAAEQVTSRVDKVNQALATVDPAIVGRLREIRDGLIEGRPESAYRGELERLAERMRPRLHD